MSEFIFVKVNYGGLPTEGRRILPGTYAPDDPALFGLAEYLVANGHAELQGTPDAPEGVQDALEQPDTVEDTAEALEHAGGAKSTVKKGRAK